MQPLHSVITLLFRDKRKSHSMFIGPDYIANSLDVVKFDLTNYGTVDELKVAIENKRNELASQHVLNITFQVIEISDFEEFLGGGTDWVKKAFYYYTLANAQPHESTEIEVGDHIVYSNSYGLPVTTCQAFGFSKAGIHNNDTPWCSTPYHLCKVNYVLTALNQRVKHLGLDNSQLSDFFTNTVAAPFVAIRLKNRLSEIGVNPLDLEISGGKLVIAPYSDHDKSAKVTIMNAFYLTITDSRLHGTTNHINKIVNDSSKSREDKLETIKTLLISVNLIP